MVKRLLRSQTEKREERKEEKGEAKFQPGELKEIIFASLGIALIFGGSILITPHFPIVLGAILKIIKEVRGEEIPETKIKRALKRLEKRKIISLIQKGENIEVVIEDKGKSEVLKYSIKKLLEFKSKKKKWRGKWFLVVFDVPEPERDKRNYLRGFLRDIGFYQYQQSVYVYPYECEEEINLVKKIVEGGRYISYIVAEKLEKEDLLKTHFKLS